MELEEALGKAADIIDDPMFANHPLDQALLMDALGRAYTGLGLYDLARALLEKALQVRRQALARDHLLIAESLNNLNNLGTYLQARGVLEDAEAAYRQASAIFREQLGDDHLHVTVTRRNLASVLTAKGDPEAAEVLAGQALASLRATMALGSWRIADAESVYAGCLAALGRFNEAEGPLLRSFEIIREARGSPRRVAQRSVSIS